MLRFQRPKKVQIEPTALERAAKFADAVVSTVNYGDSNQFNPAKIRDDHFISKIGEVAVVTVFQHYGAVVRGPDFRIYKGKEKSWEEDLFIDEIGLGVKTQTVASAERYGYSWTFQRSGKRRDPVLNAPQAWVCFVTYRQSDNTCIVYPPYQIQELTFKAPRMKHLHGKKSVVYAEDLPRIWV